MTPRRRTLAGLLLLLGLALLAPAPALAQPTPGAPPPAAPPRKKATPGPPATPVPPPRPSPWSVGVPAERQQRAFALFEDGNRYLAQALFANALQLYREAVALWDHPVIRYNMTICLVRLDRLLEAHENLTRAMRHGRAPYPSDLEYQQALTHQRQLERQLGQLRVVSYQEGAAIALDGKPLLVGPGVADRVLMPGQYRVTAALPGRRATTYTASVLPGRRLRLEATWRPPPQPRFARRFRRWVPWTVVGAGAAVLVLGAGLHGAARSDLDRFYRQLDARVPAHTTGGWWPAELDATTLGHRDRALREARAAYAFLAAGGVLTLSGLVLEALNRPRLLAGPRRGAARSPRSFVPQPALVPGGATVTWQGQF